MMDEDDLYTGPLIEYVPSEDPYKPRFIFTPSCVICQDFCMFNRAECFRPRSTHEVQQSAKRGCDRCNLLFTVLSPFWKRHKGATWSFSQVFRTVAVNIYYSDKGSKLPRVTNLELYTSTGASLIQATFMTVVTID